MKAPSPKIIYLMVVIVLFFTVFFGYGPVSKFVKNSDFRSTLSYNSGLSNALSGYDGTDTDKDNLLDWQEALWKTNPNNPDTDADGTTDGQEVAAGRDPNKPGPDDKITKPLELTASADNGFIDDPNNTSQQLSKDLFSQFMSAQVNGSLDANAQTQIINNTISNLKPEVIPNRFALNDIKVISSADKTVVKNFGNDFMIIHQDIYNKITDQTTNDQAISLYEQMVNQLSALYVPADMGLPYLNLLNNYYALSQLSKTIQQDTVDPVKALVSIKSNQDIALKNQDIYTQFATYFKNNGIIWGNNEPGQAWNNF